MATQFNDKQLKYILEKQFSFVGMQYDPEFIKEANWFHKKTWTNEAQNLFKNWLIKYINQSMEVKKSLAIKASEEFILQYGWKVEG